MHLNKMLCTIPYIYQVLRRSYGLLVGYERMAVSSAGGADRWVLDAYRAHLGDLLCHVLIHANVYRSFRGLPASLPAKKNRYPAGDQDL